MLLLLAHPVAILMGDSRLAPMIRMASLSYLFIGILGVCRGYYQSQRRMNIPAISQVIEQIIRVGLIIVAIGLFMIKDWSIYQAGTIAILASALGFRFKSLLIVMKPFLLRCRIYRKYTLERLTYGYTCICVEPIIGHIMAIYR